MPPPETQHYWLPGYGLSRSIVLSQIQYFLGPAASARPYSYQGRDGYLITGVPLTRDQIDDLAAMSREYERQESLRMAGESAGGSYGCSYSSCSSSGARDEPYINEIVWMRGAGYTNGHGETGGRWRIRGLGSSRRRVR
ncbi:uncharacterized protein BO95DRAFT_408890 [Aspergillus brunneoviolaceus CBS 621.78]|uniref:Uncharacterized protein n=1 Tax=Aspergillus brunneoviolaceus CBS 621.78 TaxID=1450534 RepID=A0ACD1GFI7_9EURO|nr:hypothetical protein BO95DRAFT_408890 [Aspergillus brunneoviolaceus CBS 621.78]RAH47987.1 hypothetical protein BO95DRAFT_408890 [Aspergillus brunneoviolaceus CBS 621.78]